MSNEINSKYIDERLPKILDYESLGRVLAYSIVQSAKEKIGSKSMESVTIDDIKAHVSQFSGPSGLLCIKLCIDTPIGRICTHIG